MELGKIFNLPIVEGVHSTEINGQLIVMPCSSTSPEDNVVENNCSHIEKDSCTNKNNISDVNKKTAAPSAEMNDIKSKLYWPRTATIRLIHLYHDHESDFQSKKKTSKSIWNEIASSINSENHGIVMSWSQCFDKMKYLKIQYSKKKDNMSSKSSGAAAMKFEYFNEMNEIFGKKPNITPEHCAASSRSSVNTERSSSKKKKKNNVDQLIEIFEQNSKKREKLQEEKLKLQRQANENFKLYSEKLFNLFEKQLE
ncbi:uncharacterized protein LOC106694206 [Microplitis demolitor]|uniref:uncharacterized protein LOC106694206 n=1 Tax=Microplitis demolitor TaxID=69319 RepID=UPI00235B6C10|nr:uncharacterized protein LOC106694206 [Microplitis demolitor]